MCRAWRINWSTYLIYRLVGNTGVGEDGRFGDISAALKAAGCGEQAILAVNNPVRLFDANKIQPCGDDHFPNVISSDDFERMVDGKLRTSNVKNAKHAAFIHCDDSRDCNDLKYCLCPCCMLR